MLSEVMRCHSMKSIVIYYLVLVLPVICNKPIPTTAIYFNTDEGKLLGKLGWCSVLPVPCNNQTYSKLTLSSVTQYRRHQSNPIPTTATNSSNDGDNLLGELCRCSSLARSLQAGKEDDRRTAVGPAREGCLLGSHDRHQLVVHHLHEQLLGGNTWWWWWGW